MRLKPAVYRNVRGLIPQASALLWRPTNPLGWCIARYTTSRYSHIGTAEIGLDGVNSLEFLQFKGGVRHDLGKYVERYPGKIDVYAPPAAPDYDSDVVVRSMLNQIMLYGRYGWWSVLSLGRWYLPGLRLFGRLDTNDDEIYEGPPHCSQARAIADAYGGRDFAKGKPRRNTTPQDIAQCPNFRYLFTLCHTEEQVQDLLAA